MSKPIYLSDEEDKLQNSQIIDLVRNELTIVRGKLSDVASNRGWKGRVEVAEHSITCVISYLYDIREEMKKFEDGELCQCCKQPLPKGTEGK